MGTEDWVLDELGWRDFLPTGVTYSPLLRLMMTDDAGELLGVSSADPVNEASVRADRTVDTESRSVRVVLSSPRIRSTSLVSSSRSETF